MTIVDSTRPPGVPKGPVFLEVLLKRVSRSDSRICLTLIRAACVFESLPRPHCNEKRLTVV